MAALDTQAPPQEARGGPRKAKLMLRTKGWQVASIAENVNHETSFNPMTQHDESAVLLNCYKPGQADEMHCHPKEEHVFLVWSGSLHLTGIEDGEEATLEAGQFAHIDANYYYRLHNPGPEPAVYVQFRTVPAQQPKQRMVLFNQSARGKREAAAAEK